MTSILRLLLAGALLLAAASCSALVPDGSVRIRLRNSSAYDLHHVVVGFPGGTHRYGTIAAGATTEYQRVDRAYGYAYVEAWVDGKRVVQQPIDYVGESLLEPGAYTYVLHLSSPDDPFGLQSALRRDGP